MTSEPGPARANARPAVRAWTTPILTGTALLSAVTGVFMFFHRASGLAHVTHEWLSWVFVGAIVAHLAVNLRPLGVALRPTPAKVAVAVFAILALAAALLPARERGEHGGRGRDRRRAETVVPDGRAAPDDPAT